MYKKLTNYKASYLYLHAVICTYFCIVSIPEFILYASQNDWAMYLGISKLCISEFIQLLCPT
jgi:hypothetical protein